MAGDAAAAELHGDRAEDVVGLIMHWISRCLVSLALTMIAGHCSIAADDQFADPPYGATLEEVQSAKQNCAANQISMNICAWSHYSDTENALETANTRLSGLLSSNDLRQSLAQADHAFREFRNATCAFDLAAIEGGSMGFSVVYRCRSVYNVRRTRGLEHYADCLAQERSCELPLFLFAYESGPGKP